MSPYSPEEIQRLVAWDHAHAWKPFTQMQDYLASEPLIIAEGDGPYLIDVRGRRLFDGVSSLWCNLLGHRHPVLDEALKRQTDRLAHSTLLGPTNPPAVRLARRLAELAPPGLNRVFFSDNGSTAVEVALKMAFQFWRHMDEPRGRFVALRNGYHGDTLGAVGVGGIEAFHGTFRPLLLPADFAPAPSPFHCDRVPRPALDEPEILFYPDDVPDAAAPCRDACLDAMDAILRRHTGDVCAVVLEPVVQGAAGMHFMAPGFLAGVRRLCDRHDVLLIADEVLTGFGRTGALFACSHEDVVPDILALSKGLTGGYMPLAATLASQRVFDAFLGDHAQFRTFFHGHTYTGNPLGCAVSLAVLDVLQHDAVIEQVPARNALLREALRRIACRRNVGRVGAAGLVGAVELVEDRPSRRPFAARDRVGHRVCQAALERGLLVRPLGDVLVIMPPLTTTAEQLAWLLGIVDESIGVVLGN